MRKLRNLSTLSSAILLLTCAESALRADDMAYFINGAVFGTIDLNTGAFTKLGTGSLNASAGLGEVGSKLYAAPYTFSTLYSVNPASGALSPIGTSSIPYYGLGSTTSGLYALGLVNGGFSLYSVNPATAATTLIGPLGMGIAPFYAWSLSTGSSTLYLADLDNLYSIDTTTGAAILIGSAVTTGGDPSALVYVNGTLYAEAAGTNTVWTLSTTSGATTFVANNAMNVASAAGLAPITPPMTPQVLPQLAFGGGWYTALYFTNTSAGAVSFPVSFTADNASPLTIPSVGGSSTTINLAPQGTAIIEAPNSGPLSQGYVSVSLPGGVEGYGVFRSTTPGIADQEAVVPLSSVSATNATLIWDDTDYTTSVAIVNPSPVPTTVSITVHDSSGNVLGTSSLVLAAGAKTETILHDLPGLGAMAGNRGSAYFTVATGSVAVLGLRFNGVAFTSIPTTEQ